MIQYITPEEATTLSKYDTFYMLEIATSIYETYILEEKSEYGERWTQSSAIAAVYNAGRVAGIRQERAKRHRA